MEYTTLGDTGLQVSRIALGCMSYGSSDWRPWVLDEGAAKPFFERALDAGINFFDTADMYSDGASEEITGKWLRELGNLDELVIATKVFFPHGEGPNLGGLSAKHIQQACEASLRRLGVDTIDLYQIHRLDPATPPEEIITALDGLVRAGKVRYLGASSMFAWEFATLLHLADSLGAARFVAMQDHYNLVERTEEVEMLPLCAHEGVGVIPWSPLARGLLAGTRESLGDDSTARSSTDGLDQMLYSEPWVAEVVDAVRTVASARGCEPAQVALAWLLAQPSVTAPIVGSTKLKHLDDAIVATELTLTDEELAALEAPYGGHRPPTSFSPGLRRRR